MKELIYIFCQCCIKVVQDATLFCSLICDRPIGLSYRES